MAEVERGKSDSSGFSVVLSAWHDPSARTLNVDLLAVLLAILLPWSTTGVLIVAGLWTVALAFTLDVSAFTKSLARPISALPIAFFALALVGTLWSDAAWGVRFQAISPTARLLILPLLFYHFERSLRGEWVFVAFLSSCTLLMTMSWLVALVPALSLKYYLSLGPFAPAKGIVVKNYIDQSQELALCAVALLYPIMTFFRANRIRLASMLAVIALALFTNMIFVVVSRTTLVTVPVLLAVFALLHLKPQNRLIASGIAALVMVVAWNTSPDLRNTANKFTNDYRETSIENEPSGLGSRLEFWQKSVGFFLHAPVAGHGTGSTRGLFEKAAIDKVGVHAEVVGNPHNQTLFVAVQWGIIGVAILFAMWTFHFLLFSGDGLAAWIGQMAVVQNVVTSMFNSHLFDFLEGWMYVLGVGVAGGMVLGATREVKEPT